MGPERIELTTAIQKHFYEALQRNYDAQRKGRKFAELPTKVQTALLSFSWQLGLIWRPRNAGYLVFKAATEENWTETVERLRKGY